MNMQTLETQDLSLDAAHYDWAHEKLPALFEEDTLKKQELLMQFRVTKRVDDEAMSLLKNGLESEQDPVRLCSLLTCVEIAPPRSVPAELIFSALCRLTEADAPAIRLSAYKWLAEIYRIDLRYENCARLVLRDRLPLESESMQARIKQLLGID